MSVKLNYIAAVCILIATLPVRSANAQQRKFIDNKPFIHFPRMACHPVTNGAHAANRSYDGTNNNIGYQKAEWGASDIPLYRELPPAYGSSDPDNAMAGASRPSARKISNSVIDEPVTTFNARGLSTFIYVWGQFIDHDMSLTPTGTTEYVPVQLPADETIFTQPIDFYRSEVRSGTGAISPRQQSNLITSWIDGSNVYGSDSVRAHWLRTMHNGKMKTSAGNLLPFNTVSGQQADSIDPNAPSMANDGDHTVKTFVAGDVRAAEHPGITSLHTLFVREHNRICDRLVAQGMTNDEQIYQKARKEVGALIEAITYQEFLPALGVTLSPYSGYRSTVRPDIMNTFATGAYRMGHSMVADDIFLRDDNCDDVGPGELDLVTAFWNPQLVVTNNIDPFLKGLAVHTQYETDTKINSVLRNLLFTSPNSPVRFGEDLGSLNIQRGRDHGLPDYNTARQYYTGWRAFSFPQITSNHALADSLQRLYGNINNVDLWIGLLAEDHLPGKSLGNTLYRMLRSQFEKLRDGDYYFYLNDPFLPASTRNTLTHTKFSDVIIRNTSLTNLQSNVFFSQACPGDSSVARRRNISEVPAQDEQAGIYPDPVIDELNVTYGSGGKGTISIYTLSGTLVKTVQPSSGEEVKMKVDVHDLSVGIYLLSLRNGTEVKSFRFVKMQD